MTNPTLDSFLDSGIASNNAIMAESAIEETEVTQIITLPEGSIDPRLKLISHSSRTTLHKCPRKFQLYRLNSKDSGSEDYEQNVTFAYGTVVGIGIQSVLEGKSEERVVLDMFLGWEADLLDYNSHQKKSFWEALFAVQRFIYMRSNGYLDDYELVAYNGKPAVELGFRIILPDGFEYRGFVDVVLRHTLTGEILVLELKTSSGNPNSAMFKNSGQALGYSVVLDILFPTLSSYTVLYLIYATKQREFIQMPFEKSLLQKALWLQELLIDTKHIELYESYGTYPMHGEACYDFFRECEYMSLCTLATCNLVAPLTQAALDKIEEDRKKYHFTVDFYDLVEAQLAKGT